MPSDRLRPTGIPAVLTSDPAAAFDCGSDHGVIGSKTVGMKPLSHGVTVPDHVERGFSDLVMSLEPEGSATRLALAAAPTLVSQRQTLFVACHTVKIASLANLSRNKVKT